MHCRIPFLIWLSTTAARGVNAHQDQNKDEGSSYSPLVAELDPLSTERTAFDPMVQLHLNWTRPGKRRGPKRSLPRSLLEARQANQCNPSNFVLVCPATEHSPCCPPEFLVCCHDPSDTCCPVGTFCAGLQTCCVNGATGCGEGCCAPGLVCGTVNGAQTCVDPASSGVAAPTTAAATTTRGQGGGSDTTTGPGVGSGTSSSVAFADPTYSPSDQGAAKVSPAVIGGAVGGGVGALILIALLAWYLLRQKKSNAISEPAGPESIPVPYTNGQPPMAAVPVVHDSSPAYPEGHPPPPVMSKSNHPWSQNSSSAASSYPYGSTGHQGTSYGNTSSPPPPGSVVGGVMTMSDAGSSGVVGPGGYVPPPPEDVPIMTSQGPGGGYYGGPATAYNATSPTAYSPSRHNTMSAAGTGYSDTPPWVTGIGSPSIEQQQQQQPYHQQQSQQSHQGYSQQQHTPWTSGISSSTHDQQPQPPSSQQQQSLQLHQAPPQPWLHPGLAASPSPMSPPPPPFSPGPYGAPPPQEGSSGGGRVVPMTAPADRKARPTGGNGT